MKSFLLLSAIGAILGGSQALAQDKPSNPAAGHPGVDPKRVDEAIKKGVEFLKGAKSIPAGFDFGPKDSDELILLTYAHAGVPETDPKVQELLRQVLEGPVKSTYEASLLAMALQAYNR